MSMEAAPKPRRNRKQYLDLPCPRQRRAQQQRQPLRHLRRQ